MHIELNITFKHTQRLYICTNTLMQQILSHEIDLVISKEFITKKKKIAGKCNVILWSRKGR